LTIKTAFRRPSRKLFSGAVMAAEIFTYAAATKTPAANGRFSAIFENIYCTWVKIE
jgi:hypothetical protein